MGDQTPGLTQYSVRSQLGSSKSDSEARARTVGEHGVGVLPSGLGPWPKMYTASPSASAKNIDENQVRSAEPTSSVVYFQCRGSERRTSPSEATSGSTINEVPMTVKK